MTVVNSKCWDVFINCAQCGQNGGIHPDALTWKIADRGLDCLPKQECDSVFSARCPDHGTWPVRVDVAQSYEDGITHRWTVRANGYTLSWRRT